MQAYRDAASRLAEGQPAVDVIAEYVWSSAMVGYHHAELTASPGDVHRWYASEDGLSLSALDADRTALGSAAATGEQALRLQDDLLRSVAVAWHGDAAATGQDFLVRHAAASEQAVAALHTAADALAELRDALWAAVDRKAQSAIDVEGRFAAQRGAWLSAARTVRTGVGDRDAACELVDQQVVPFVATQVAGDWLTAMRGATAAVTAAYENAVATLRAVPLPAFGVPGELGPRWTPPRLTASVAPAGPPAAVPPTFSPAAQTIPSGFGPASTPMFAPAPLDLPAAAPAGAPAAPPEVSTPGAGLGGGPGDLGTGLGALPGLGLSGLGQRLADMFGGLIGSSDAATSLPDIEPLDIGPGAGLDDDESGAELDDEERDDERDGVLDGAGEDEDDDGQDDDGEEIHEPEASDDDDQTPEAPGPEADAPPAPAPVIAPAVDPVPATSPPAAVPPEPMGTPCEIAADELPQVGA